MAILLILLSVAAGYLAARWCSGARDTTPLAQICARVDYMNELQQEIEGAQALSQEMRAEFSALVEQCREAMRNWAEENY
jgi:hypothetical protein